MIKHVCLVAGETVEEQRKKMQTINIAQPSTNVIVQPPKVSQRETSFSSPNSIFTGYDCLEPIHSIVTVMTALIL